MASCRIQASEFCDRTATEEEPSASGKFVRWLVSRPILSLTKSARVFQIVLAVGR